MTFVELLEILPEKVSKKWVKDNINIIDYIPIVEKYATAKVLSKIILDMAENINYKDSVETNYIYIKYDIYTTLTLLCKYMNIDIEDVDKTSANYDIVLKSGLFDNVMCYCEKDYNRTKEIIDRIVGIEDISIYRELGRVLTSDAYFDRMKESKDILNSIDLSKYEALKEINSFNNPLVNQVMQIIKNTSLEEAKKRQSKVSKNGKKK